MDFPLECISTNAGQPTRTRCSCVVGAGESVRPLKVRVVVM